MAFEWLKDLQKLKTSTKKNSRMKAPAPLSERYNPMGAPLIPTGGGNGGGEYNLSAVKFTGAGPDGKINPSRVSSINSFAEHEGEVVIPADKVMKLGGPDKVNQLIEQGAMQEAGQGMVGYQTGGTVSQMDLFGKKNTSLAVPKAEATKPGQLNVPAPEQSEYRPILFAGAKEIQKTAQGESESLKRIGNIARKTLAEKQAEEQKASKLNLGQLGAGVPEATAATQALGIEQGKARTELERGLATNAAQAAIDAQKSLVDIGFKGQAFEQELRDWSEKNRQWNMTFDESKKEFEKQFELERSRFGLSEKEFEEQKNQFAQNKALELARFDWGKATEAYSAQIAAGDYNGAAATMAAHGIKIDVASLENEKTSSLIIQGLTDLSTDALSGFSFDNPIVQKHAQDMANALGKPLSEIAETYKNLILNQDPAYKAASMISDQTYNSLPGIEAIGGLDNFRYGNLTGRNAAIAAMTAYNITGGFYYDASGKPVYNDAFYDLFGKGGTEQKYSESVPTSVPLYGTFKGTDDKIYIKTGENAANLASTYTPTFKEPIFTSVPNVGDVATFNGKTYIRTTADSGGTPGTWTDIANITTDDLIANPDNSIARAIVKAGYSANPEKYTAVMEGLVSDPELAWSVDPSQLHYTTTETDANGIVTHVMGNITAPGSKIPLLKTLQDTKWNSLSDIIPKGVTEADWISAGMPDANKINSMSEGSSIVKPHMLTSDTAPIGNIRFSTTMNAPAFESSANNWTRMIEGDIYNIQTSMTDAKNNTIPKGNYKLIRDAGTYLLVDPSIKLPAGVQWEKSSTGRIYAYNTNTHKEETGYKAYGVGMGYT